MENTLLSSNKKHGLYLAGWYAFAPPRVEGRGGEKEERRKEMANVDVLKSQMASPPSWETTSSRRIERALSMPLDSRQ